MSKPRRPRQTATTRPQQPEPATPPVDAPPVQTVPSLLDAMSDGKEYGSIVAAVPQDLTSLVVEQQRALAGIEQVRGRPCLAYISNVTKPQLMSPIEISDDLPFNEMVSLVDSSQRNVDILLVTPGGSGQQVSQFVNTLRGRFDSVEFLLPHMAMSAGTLWALSGDRIWMDSRAFIGPIDPQVPVRGQYVPAQSVWTLLDAIKKQGEDAVRQGQPPNWALIRVLDNLDPRLLGDALSASQYSITMAADFLATYKFRTWTHHRDGRPVTPDEKQTRAIEIATLLCSNERWKSHGHGITREVASGPELRLVIDKLEDQAGLEPAVRRFWALAYWIFDHSPTAKVLLSQNYVLVRNGQLQA